MPRLTFTEAIQSVIGKDMKEFQRYEGVKMLDIGEAIRCNKSQPIMSIHENRQFF